MISKELFLDRLEDAIENYGKEREVDKAKRLELEALCHITGHRLVDVGGNRSAIVDEAGNNVLYADRDEMLELVEELGEDLVDDAPFNLFSSVRLTPHHELHQPTPGAAGVAPVFVFMVRPGD
jgi:hypothetical protein